MEYCGTEPRMRATQDTEVGQSGGHCPDFFVEIMEKPVIPPPKPPTDMPSRPPLNLQSPFVELPPHSPGTEQRGCNSMCFRIVRTFLPPLNSCNARG